MSGYSGYGMPLGRPLYNPVTGYENGQPTSRSTAYSEAQRSGLIPLPLQLTPKPSQIPNQSHAHSAHQQRPARPPQPQRYRNHRKNAATKMREEDYDADLSTIVPGEDASVIDDEFISRGRPPTAYQTQSLAKNDRVPGLTKEANIIPYHCKEELYDGLPDPKEREIKPLFYPPHSQPSGSGNQVFNQLPSGEVYNRNVASEYQAAQGLTSANPESLTDMVTNQTYVNRESEYGSEWNDTEMAIYSDSVYSGYEGKLNNELPLSTYGSSIPPRSSIASSLRYDERSDIGPVSPSSAEAASDSAGYGSSPYETHTGNIWKAAHQGRGDAQGEPARLGMTRSRIGDSHQAQEPFHQSTVEGPYASHGTPMLAAAFISHNVSVTATPYPRMDGSDWRALQVAGDVLSRQGLGSEFREFLSKTNLPGRSAEMMADVERRAFEGAAARPSFGFTPPTYAPAPSAAPNTLIAFIPPSTFVPDAPTLVPGPDHIPVAVAAARARESKEKAKRKTSSGPEVESTTNSKKTSLLPFFFGKRKSKEEPDGSLT